MGLSLKGRFVLSLLLTSTVDAEGHNVLLGWAVVESENQHSWTWFLEHLRVSIPKIWHEPCTVISDRDKGLLQAEEVLGPRICRGYCCHHLKQNFVGKFGRGLAPTF